MKTLRDSIIEHEGTGPMVNGRFMPYKDSLGFWTIGYGRCIEKIGISQEEALFQLENDINNAVQSVKDRIPWVSRLNEVRQAVLFEMAFQMGIERLLKFVNTLAHVFGGRYKLAADAMRDSLWARQTPNRASVLAARMETGSWGE